MTINSRLRYSLNPIVRVTDGFRWAIYPEPIPGACPTFQMVNQTRVPVLHFCASDHADEIRKCSDTTTVVIEIPRLNLNVG